MIFGFNTDIKHEETIYHVQSEAREADMLLQTQVFVRGRWKFRVGQIVYIAFSKDETMMGFAFPKEERQMLIEWSEKKGESGLIDYRAKKNSRKLWTKN